MGVKALSPHKYQLAYVYFGEDKTFLCVTDADGQSEPKVIASFSRPQFISNIVWSNNGQKIAYIVDSGFDDAVVTKAALWVYDFKSMIFWQISSDSTTLAFDPAWSPNDKYLAYSARNELQDFDIYVADISTGKTMFSAGNTGVSDVEPSWWDNNLIGFTVLPENGISSFGRIQIP